MSRYWISAIVAVMGAVILTVWVWSRGTERTETSSADRSGEQRVRNRLGLPEGVSLKEYREAEQRYWTMYRRRPERFDVFSLAGELAVQEGRLATAVECFQEIPSDHPRYGLSARLQEGQVLVRLDRARQAERSLREFLTLADEEPSVPDRQLKVAYNWLIYLLSVELRFEDRKVFLAELHDHGLAAPFDSMQYYFPHLLIWHTVTGSDPLEEFLKTDPDNPHLRIAQARYDIYDGRLEAARERLEALCEESPANLDCTAALLECHFERNDWEAFSPIAESLPGYADDEPWLLTRMRAEFARHEEQWDEAARYFQHVLEKDPTNPRCQMGLAKAYAALGRSEDRKRALHRSLVLARIRPNLHNVREHDPEACRELAVDCEAIGLDEASEVFRTHAQRIERGLQKKGTVTP